jgi:hypothetical protein
METAFEPETLLEKALVAHDNKCNDLGEVHEKPPDPLGGSSYLSAADVPG